MAREMKDSGIEWIGEIPREWETARLKALFSFGKGLPITKENLCEFGVPVISYGQIHSKTNTGVKVQKDLIRYVSESYLETNEQSLVNESDFIFADTSEDIDGCGNCVYVDSQSVLFAGYHTIILHSRKNRNNRYLAYLFKTDNWRSQIRGRVSGVKVFSISRKILSDAAVLLPPVSEQQTIADFLDTQCTHIDSVIEKTRAAIEAYKRLKQSVITQAVTKGICPNREMKDSGIEWIGEIPKEWVCVKFKYIAQVRANLVHPDDYGNYPQVSPENIEKGTGKILPCKTVRETGVISDNHLFYKGQILYSKIRPILNKVTIAPFDGLCSADMYPIETDINKYYLLYALLSDSYLVNIRLITEDRVKMPKINQEELSNIFFAVPDKNEQSEIVAYLNEKTAAIDSLIQKKEQLISELEAYKKSLIYEYVTGKKEVLV